MKYLLLFSASLLMIGAASADYTVGPALGGSKWSGNTTTDNTIEYNNYIELIRPQVDRNCFDVGGTVSSLAPQYTSFDSLKSNQYSHSGNLTNLRVLAETSGTLALITYHDNGSAYVYKNTSVDYGFSAGDQNISIDFFIKDDEVLAVYTYVGDYLRHYDSVTSETMYFMSGKIETSNLYATWSSQANRQKVYCAHGNYSESGNLTAWHDAGSGQETYELWFNFTSVLNHSDYYRDNTTGSFVLLGANQVGNKSYSLSTKYRDTEPRTILHGNTTHTPELLGITFKTQASAAGAPSITSYAPLGTIWPEVQDAQLFNVTVNQTTQCRWYVNGTLKQTNSSLSLTHAYTNTSLNGGGCNVTAVCNNTNGTDTKTWLFEVGADSVTYIVLKDQPTNQTLIAEWNVTRIGSNITDWGWWQNHTYNGWTYYFRFTNGTAIMNTTAMNDNESLWFNHTSLLPTGVYFINVSEAPPSITNVQNGSISDTSQYVNWTVNQTTNNRVIYDTGAIPADSTTCDGAWSATHACANASDGNWTSYAESAGALTSYAYFNYTVQSGANQSESLWHVKDTSGHANLTIPDACWGNTIYCRARCSDVANSAIWQCDNGTSWITLRTVVANIIYEQEMTFKYTSDWDNSTAAPNITLTGLTAATTYNFHARSYSVAETPISSNSSTYSFTTTGTATNDMTLYANEYALINKWTTAQNCSQIDANISNMVCGSWYNHTSGLWEGYRSGYSYNADAEIPKNNSAFIFIDAQTTVSAEIHAGGITIRNATWFYGMLPGSTAKTLTEIETAMDSDGLDVWSLYGWSNVSQAYTETGGYSVAPNEGYAVYVNTTGEWTP